ncbi:MAG: hypothetical protein ACRDI2_16895 [Chloroflexota bacterium]
MGVLAVFSAWRTLVVARGAEDIGTVQSLYAGTAVLALIVLGLAVWLAHP